MIQTASSRSGLLLAFVPLYAGPVLAGWSQATANTILILATLFFLMQLLSGKEVQRGAISRPVFLLMLAGAQLAVVALSYGVGLGLAKLLGPLNLPLIVPIGLTFLGAIIGGWRYHLDPGEAEMQAKVDLAVAAHDSNADKTRSPETPKGSATPDGKDQA